MTLLGHGWESSEKPAKAPAFPSACTHLPSGDIWGFKSGLLTRCEGEKAASLENSHPSGMPSRAGREPGLWGEIADCTNYSEGETSQILGNSLENRGLRLACLRVCTLLGGHSVCAIPLACFLLLRIFSLVSIRNSPTNASLQGSPARQPVSFVYLTLAGDCNWLQKVAVTSKRFNNKVELWAGLPLWQSLPND